LRDEQPAIGSAMVREGRRLSAEDADNWQAGMDLLARMGLRPPV
jgi:hypothetical protein